MLPRVDLPEALLEVFARTGADTAFTSVTGGEARLKDLHVSIAALLVAHGCNVGYTPVVGTAEALRYDRLSHVDQTYVRLETYRAANAALAKDAELLVLRHENAVLRRQLRGPVRYEPSDRFWLAELSSLTALRLEPGLPGHPGDATRVAPQAGREAVGLLPPTPTYRPSADGGGAQASGSARP